MSGQTANRGRFILIKRLFAILMGFFLAICIGECLVRVLFSSRQIATLTLRPSEERTFQIPIYRPDPVLFWRTKPMARYKGLSINSAGFRGHEFQRAKRPGILRIVTMGDSSTLGVGVSDEETYAAQLERMLNDGAGEGSSEVINAGAAGYSSLQGMRYLAREIIKYHPDLVTLYFGLNDYLYAATESDRDRRYIANWRVYLDQYLRRSQLYALVKTRVNLFLAPKTGFPPPRRVEVADFKKNLATMVEKCQESGVRVLLLNVPLRPHIPLVVNPLPVKRGSDQSPDVEWVRPAYLGAEDFFVKSDFGGPTSTLEAAVSRYPEWAMAHYLLARRYEQTGESEKAKLEYQKARETDVDRHVVDLYNKAIEEVAVERGVGLVDLVRVFEGGNGGDLLLDERHPSPAGHRLIAEEICRTIRGEVTTR